MVCHIQPGPLRIVLDEKTADLLRTTVVLSLQPGYLLCSLYPFCFLRVYPFLIALSSGGKLSLEDEISSCHAVVIPAAYFTCCYSAYLMHEFFLQHPLLVRDLEMIEFHISCAGSG